METLAHLVLTQGLLSPWSRVCVTGGGAYKFKDMFDTMLKIKYEAVDEFASLVQGLDFMRHADPEEVYYVSQFDFNKPLEKTVYHGLKYPFLVVNIGVLSVQGARPPLSRKGYASTEWFHRVGGSAVGGGTFYGLCRALTGCNSFQEALDLAAKGKASNVNLLVGDIYGGDYSEFNLPWDTVAANFGKLVRPGSMEGVSKADLARAALVMVTSNIGSLANLYAHRVLNVPEIVFCGNLLTGNNEISLRTLAHACNYWSNGKTQALFLKHEGYLGAVGSLLLGSGSGSGTE